MYQTLNELTETQVTEFLQDESVFDWNPNGTEWPKSEVAPIVTYTVKKVTGLRKDGDGFAVVKEEKLASGFTLEQAEDFIKETDGTFVIEPTIKTNKTKLFLVRDGKPKGYKNTAKFASELAKVAHNLFS